VVLHRANTGEALGGQHDRLTMRLMWRDVPEMHHATLYRRIDRPSTVSPRLVTQLRVKRVADGPIVGSDRREARLPRVSRLRRLTLPTSLPSHITGTRLIPALRASAVAAIGVVSATVTIWRIITASATACVALLLSRDRIDLARNDGDALTQVNRICDAARTW
jgi:hypothetical protein